MEARKPWCSQAIRCLGSGCAAGDRVIFVVICTKKYKPGRGARDLQPPEFGLPLPHGSKAKMPADERRAILTQIRD
jgi:hypothetical protein